MEETLHENITENLELLDKEVQQLKEHVHVLQSEMTMLRDELESNRLLSRSALARLKSLEAQLEDDLAAPDELHEEDNEAESTLSWDE